MIFNTPLLLRSGNCSPSLQLPCRGVFVNCSEGFNAYVFKTQLGTTHVVIDPCYDHIAESAIDVANVVTLELELLVGTLVADAKRYQFLRKYWNVLHASIVKHQLTLSVDITNPNTFTETEIDAAIDRAIQNHETTT